MACVGSILADIISRLEALERVVGRESVLEGSANDTVRLGRMSFDDTIRVTGSISNCSEEAVRTFARSFNQNHARHL
jgi:hypothetical protein